MNRTVALLLGPALLVALAACGDGGETVMSDPPCDDCDTQEPLWACPDGWTLRAEGLGCAPPELPTDCPEGAFGLPDGSCSTPWTCPEGWSRLEGETGCTPPSLPDCPDGALSVPGGCTQTWECPAGWQRTDGSTGCRPGFAQCPDLHLPQADGSCMDLGLDACGEGTWGDYDWPEGTVYVDPEADAEGADGTRARPAVSIEQALEIDRLPAVMALAAGSYDGLVLHNNLRIRGRCASMVQMGRITTLSGRGYISDVTVRGDDFGLEVSGGRMHVERVHVIGAVEAGAIVEGELRATAMLMQDIENTGVYAWMGGEAILTNSVIRDVVRSGVEVAQRDSVAELNNVWIHDTEVETGVGYGGVFALFGGTVRATDLRVTRAQGTGIYAAEGHVELERVTAEGTVAAGFNTGTGTGMLLVDSTGSVVDAYLHENTQVGLVVRSSELEVARVTIEDTRRWGGSRHRLGVEIDSDGLTVQDLSVSGGSYRAVQVTDSTDVTLERVYLFVGYEDEPMDGDAWQALYVADAAATVEGMEIVSAVGRGVHAVGSAELTLRGVHVRSPMGADVAQVGDGIVATEGTTITATDVVVDGAAAGSYLALGGTLNLERAASVRPVGDAAVGLISQEGTVVATDLYIANSEHFGLVSCGHDARTQLTRVAVDGRGSEAIGIAIWGGDHELRDVAIHDSTFVGMYTHDDTANCLPEGFEGSVEDPTGLMTGVVVEDTALKPGTTHGSGLVIHGGIWTLDDARIEGHAGYGLEVRGEGQSLTARNIAVVGNGYGAPEAGAGLFVADQAQAEIDDLAVVGGASIGVFVHGGHAVLERVLVYDIEYVDSIGSAGLAVQEGGSLTARDVLAEANDGFGFFAATAASKLDAQRVVVDGTDPGNGGGDGVAAFDEAEVSLTDFVSSGNVRGGLLASQTTLVASRGVIRGNAVGVLQNLDGEAELTQTVVDGNEDDDLACLESCVDHVGDLDAPPPLPGLGAP